MSLEQPVVPESKEVPSHPPHHRRKQTRSGNTQYAQTPPRRAPGGKIRTTDEFLFFFSFLKMIVSFILLHCCAGFSQQWGLHSSCGPWASPRGGFSCGARASALAARGLSSCGFRPLEHRLSSCGTWAQWHLGSSQTRDQTFVPCIGRQIHYR